MEENKPKIAGLAPIVEIVKAGTYSWCSCGLSSTQPFCDGSHSGTKFSPLKVEIDEEKKCAWCTCKQSSKGAFCDGTHKRL